MSQYNDITVISKSTVKIANNMFTIKNLKKMSYLPLGKR